MNVGPASTGRRRKAVLAAIAAIAICVPMQVAAPALAAGDPAYARTLGGPGHALLYPSGLEVAPDGSVVVADTGNDKVSKYGSDGSLQWEVKQLVGDDGPLENTRDIAVAADGMIYVADAGRARIVKFDEAGNQLGDPWRGPTGDRIGSPIGISEKNGLIYVADGNKKKIRVFQPDGTQVRAIGSDGVCQMAAVRDADADAAGNVYVANYTSQNILKLSATGTCLAKWGTKGTGNGQFKNPYGIRLANDPVWGESVYVADSNNNRVQIFSPGGTFRAVVGSDGDPDEVGTFTTMRRVAVAADGDVWGADLWGSRAVRFDRTESGFSYAQTIGNGLAPLQDVQVFNEVRGLAFSADGTVNAVDTVNQRVVRMTLTGTVLDACGGRTEKTTSINWPRDVAVDPVTGDRWVADTKQNRLQVWPVDCLNQSRIGGGGAGTALGKFNWPHGIEIRASDRVAFVADTRNHRVLAYDVATRTPLTAFGVRGGATGQFFEPRGIAVAADGTILVADSRNNRVVRLDYSKAGGFTWQAEYSSGFNTPEGVAGESDGTIWVADTGNHRVVLLSATGTFERELTAADGQNFNAPASIAVDSADRAHVSDTQNHRIVVFTNGSDPQPPPPDDVAPMTSLSAPSAGEVLPVGPVAIVGSATDNTGVTSAQVAVRNRLTGQWWTGSAWGSFTWIDASLAAPGAASTGFSYSFTGGAAGGSYWLLARSGDAAGNVSANSGLRFDLAGGDTTKPTVELSAPASGEVLPVGPVAVAGSAADNTGVTVAQVAIKDRLSGQWWNGTGWQGGLQWIDASLAAPGAASTGFSYSFTGGAAGGSYWLQVRSGDAAGNVRQQRAPLRSGRRRHDQADGGVERAASGEVLPVGPVAVAGSAADNTGVTVAQVAIKDRLSGQWWNGTGWQGGLQWIDASLAAPGAASTASPRSPVVLRAGRTGCRCAPATRQGTGRRTAGSASIWTADALMNPPSATYVPCIFTRVAGGASGHRRAVGAPWTAAHQYVLRVGRRRGIADSGVERAGPRRGGAGRCGGGGGVGG